MHRILKALMNSYRAFLGAYRIKMNLSRSYRLIVCNILLAISTNEIYGTGDKLGKARSQYCLI